MAAAEAAETYRIAKLSELREHPQNPRQGDVGAIITSIERNGFYGALEVQKSTGYVIVGNHRLKALRALKAKIVPIIENDCDDATALRILLADNRSSDLATYDEPLLLSLLTDVAERDDLLGTGYDGDDVDALIRASEEPLHLGGNGRSERPEPEPDPGSIFSIVYFRDADAQAAFFDMIGQQQRTSIWYPEE